MMAIQRILGAYALLIAVAVGVNFIATPLYDDGSTGFPVWRVLNWFMAAGVLVALISSVFPKPTAGCEAKILLGGSILLFLWFFWNWFGDLMSREEPLMWAFIDPLFVLVVGACGLRLWRAG